MEKLIIAGFIVMFIGILLIVVGSIGLALFGKVKAKNVDIGIGGFIGPIPFGFFTSKKIFLIWLLFLIFTIIIWFFIRNRL